MTRTLRRWGFGAAALAALLMAAPVVTTTEASAGTLDTIRAERTIRIAYRNDAPPFSYTVVNNAEPTGYMIDLCRAVARRLADQLGLTALAVTYVPVTSANRFDAIEKRAADLLCEPTSITLARRRQVDFSVATFVDGAGLMTRDTNLRDFVALSGRKVGVLGGTTTEERLRNHLTQQKIPAEIVSVRTHEEGLQMIDSGSVAAYFADRSILMFLLRYSRQPDALAIADNALSMEPYALALARGDSEFRLAVDTALSHIYRSGEIGAIFDRAFGNRARPSELLRALFVLSALPD